MCKQVGKMEIGGTYQQQDSCSHPQSSGLGYDGHGGVKQTIGLRSSSELKGEAGSGKGQVKYIVDGLPRGRLPMLAAWKIGRIKQGTSKER